MTRTPPDPGFAAADGSAGRDDSRDQCAPDTAWNRACVFCDCGVRRSAGDRNAAAPGSVFALDIVKPLPLTGEIVEVEERLGADGAVVRPLERGNRWLEAARRLVGKGVRTAAIALMHSYRNPVHERRVAEILREAGFTHVSVSAELAPVIKLAGRVRRLRWSMPISPDTPDLSPTASRRSFPQIGTELPRMS